VEFPAYGDYKGYDLFCRDPSVEKLDITKEKMRPCHLILCRDVFIHLPNSLVCDALKLFRKTGLGLLSTTFPGVNNYDRENDITMHHQKLDLCEGPFFLGEPVGYLPEHYEPGGKFLGFWRLQ
jgi:hypothetical protein